MTARLLALDTATDVLVLGLATPAGRWCAHLPGGAEASARLLPAVLDLLAQADTRLDALDAIAFGQGPGAFTGLRTACAVAQGLALGAGKPVLPVDSLLTVAEAARVQVTRPEGLWWAAVDARMDEVYAGCWQWVPAPAPAAGHGQALGQDGPGPDAPGPDALGHWQVVQPPALYTLAALNAAWQAEPPVRVAGNAPAVFGDRLPCPTATTWPDTADRAAALLRLAQAAWQAGAGLDADQALPVYLRDKVAQTTAERLQLAQAKRAAADAVNASAVTGAP